MLKIDVLMKKVLRITEESTKTPKTNSKIANKLTSTA